MEEHQIRRLIVADREHRLVGIISLGDLVLTTGDERLAREALERVSEPAPAAMELDEQSRPAA
jgi:CBS domain-containing protein